MRLPTAVTQAHVLAERAGEAMLVVTAKNESTPYPCEVRRLGDVFAHETVLVMVHPDGKIDDYRSEGVRAKQKPLSPLG